MEKVMNEWQSSAMKIWIKWNKLYILRHLLWTFMENCVSMVNFYSISFHFIIEHLTNEMRTAIYIFRWIWIVNSNNKNVFFLSFLVVFRSDAIELTSWKREKNIEWTRGFHDQRMRKKHLLTYCSTSFRFNSIFSSIDIKWM